MKKILYVHNAPTRFVLIDREILKKNYELTELCIKHKSQFNLFKLFVEIKSSDIVFCWFASWHSFLPLLITKLFKNKKSILVGGGYDSASIKEAEYGNQLRFISRVITNRCFKLANKIICNSNFTANEISELNVKFKNKIAVAHHGIQISKRSDKKSKKNIALNVGNVNTQNLKRKGIEPFLKAGEFAQEVEFIQVGKIQEKSLEALLGVYSKNVTVEGFVTDERLNHLYSTAKFYVQPSLHEGFGLSVVEAMLYECVPIVSKHGALSEVIDGNGIVLENILPKTIGEAISKLSNAEIRKIGVNARNKVLQDYKISDREKSLMAILSKLV